MEDTVVKGILLAIGVLVCCGLISLIFMNYNSARGLAISSYETMQDLADEYKSSEIKMLESSEINGSTVISMIRKYQDKCTVTVQNTSGVSAIEYDRDHHFVNTSNSTERYVDPSSSYICKASYNSNGVLTSLNFTKRGLEELVDVNDIDVTKRMMGDVLGMDDTELAKATWTDLKSQLMAACNDTESVSAKRRILASSYVDASLSLNDSWSDVLDSLFSKVSNMSSDLADLRNHYGDFTPYRNYQGTLRPFDATDASGNILREFVSVSTRPSSCSVTTEKDGVIYYFTYLHDENVWMYAGSSTNGGQDDFTGTSVGGVTMTLHPGNRTAGLFVWTQESEDQPFKLINYSDTDIIYDFSIVY